jgi:hypothetical protein
MMKGVRTASNSFINQTEKIMVDRINTLFTTGCSLLRRKKTKMSM